MEPIHWLFLTAAITLACAVILLNPIQAAMDEAVQNNAHLQVRTIASTINLVSTAPDGTDYTMNLPGSKCRVLITPSSVKLTMQEGDEMKESYGIIKTGAVISQNFEFDCAAANSIKITKRNGALNFEVV